MQRLDYLGASVVRVGGLFTYASLMPSPATAAMDGYRRMSEAPFRLCCRCGREEKSAVPATVMSIAGLTVLESRSVEVDYGKAPSRVHVRHPASTVNPVRQYGLSTEWACLRA
jgi:hypothetical protein